MHGHANLRMHRRARPPTSTSLNSSFSASRRCTSRSRWWGSRSGSRATSSSAVKEQGAWDGVWGVRGGSAGEAVGGGTAADREVVAEGGEAAIDCRWRGLCREGGDAGRGGVEGVLSPMVGVSARRDAWKLVVRPACRPKVKTAWERSRGGAGNHVLVTRG